MKNNKAVVKVMAPKREQPGSIAPLVHEMLQVLGENPAREGLERTPERSDRR